MSADRFQIRQANSDDAPIIARFRAGMFYDLGRIDEREAAEIEAATAVQVRDLITRKDFYAWICEADGRAAGCGAVTIRRLLPRPGNHQGAEEAYILNMYTTPGYRRQGMARQLMNSIIAWCRERGCERITLHPSVPGRPLYESLGFVPNNELLLKQD